MLIDTSTLYSDAVVKLATEEAVVLDVETNGLDAFGMNQICGVGVAPLSSDETYYFPFRHQQGTNLLPTELKQLMDLLSNCKTLIGYNIKFDLHFLRKEGLRTDGQTLIDAIVMVRLAEPANVKDLGLTPTIQRRYGEEEAQYDIETKKELRSNKWHKDFSLAPPDVLGPYCEQDVYWTRRIYWDLLPQISKSNQQDIFNLGIELTTVLLDMEDRGIVIDTEYVNEAMKKIEVRKEILQNKIHSLVGEFNINSTKQMGEVLNKHGIYSPVKTPKGKQSWGEAALIKLNHSVAGYIRQYRTLEKLRSTYLEPNIDLQELHTGFCNWGTVTGRLSSRNPNLQNIPRNHFKLEDAILTDEDREEVYQRVNAILATKGDEGATELSPEVIDTWAFIGDESYDETSDSQIAIRRLFKPRPNYYLVGFDYSQMEVRVFLSYLQNEDIHKLLSRTDVDFHGEAAKLAFDSHEDNDDFKFYRQMAKAITFGTIYGIGNKKLAIQLGTTPKEAGQYKKRYFEGLKGSKPFFDSVVRMVETRGWIKNRYGRLYKIVAEMGYKGVNYLVQGTSADILNERLIEVHKLFKDTKSHLLLQVHDEVICEIHKDDIRTLPQKVKQCMIENSLNIPLQVDMELCDPSWATKVDLDKALANGHFKQTRLEDFIIWDDD